MYNRTIYLYSDLIVDACLLLLDLFFELFQRGRVWGCAIGLEDLDVPTG